MSNKKVNLREWDSTFLPEYTLKSQNSIETAKILQTKGIIEIIELKNGLQINTNSYVGKIELDDIQIIVKPKISGLVLYRLLKYSFGLNNLKIFEHANQSIEKYSFVDILIYQLYMGTEDLLRRGVSKDYLKMEENLSSPKGRIDIVKLSRKGGVIDEKLPCKYFYRCENTVLNQIILSGIKLAISLASDYKLRIKLERISKSFEESVDRILLNRINLQRAKNSINRLNERYSPLLEIINILFESNGISDNDFDNIKLNGYFFDMNFFFETLIGKLISNCVEEYTIKTQHNLNEIFIYNPSHNPKKRRSHIPRPDFAIINKGKVIKLFDAKYRDLWEKNLPSDMLYQLSIYAISSETDKCATILYPSISDIPILQEINIKEPAYGRKIGSVRLQPVNLNKLSLLIENNEEYELKRYVNSILQIN